MSNLSGYDSEAIGFDSVSLIKRTETDNATQTTEFSESGVGSQTYISQSAGCTASPDELQAQDDILKEYPPPGLNEFLRKVVPSMLEQLDENGESLFNSSDSEDDDIISSQLFQEINNNLVSFGAGDQSVQVLAATFSSAGNTLAISLGKLQHDEWCQHNGMIRIYTAKHSKGNKFVHVMDITEKNCISTLKFHHSVAALLAYGTASGEVVLCNLTDSISGVFDEDMQLTSPSGCHGSRNVTSLHWADTRLANTFLIQQIGNTGKRRGASDQILISSGSDGTINIWQVNVNLKIFSNVVCYDINGSRKTPAPDITCLDFAKSFPLRPSEEKTDDIFVVGSKSGKLYKCRTKTGQPILNSNYVDPVYDMIQGHMTCVLGLIFSYQKPDIFVSASIDYDMRVFDVNQPSPIRVLNIDVPISSLAWLPHDPSLVAVGLWGAGELLRLYNVATGNHVRVDGWRGIGYIICLAVSQTGSCRIAAGDTEGTVRVYELPTTRVKVTSEDLQL